jgi:release factor-specific protein-(glutamine-N5) methyltransferase
MEDKNIKKNYKNKVGGMALFNGLLLRNEKRESITQIINDDIIIDINEINKNEGEKSFFKNLPLIRGVYNIIKTISSSAPYVISSAKKILNEISKEEDVKIDKVTLTFGYIISITLILSFFTAIPNVISAFFDINIQNLVQCIIQSLIFIIYLIILNKLNILKEIFKYHGAEHKVVNAYENLEKKDITLENVKKESRFHKRCGGNFVVYFFIAIIITTLVIPSSNLFIKSILQLLLMPLLIGISYELLMLMSKLPKAFSFLSYPAMAIQFITTKEPDDNQIKLAIYGLFGCVNESNKMSVKNYLDDYIQKNENLDYELNDMLKVVAFVTGIDKENVFLKINDEVLEYNTQIKLDKLLDDMYIKNIPLQYILGKQPFYNEQYIVTKDVLIPRADSEILVEKATEYIDKYGLKTMIDLCSGSGCIGISCAKNSTINKVFLTDISMKALDVSKKNILLNNADDKVLALLSNLLEIYMQNDNKYDIIVSNPPYIPSDDIKGLSKQVQNEPHIALDGGKNGLDIYGKIFKQAKNVLKPQGFLLIEIGYNQLNDITKLITKHFEYEILESVKDLGGNDRVIICRFLRM